MAVRIDIISGFLGAGKTTLINKMLPELASDERVALIENEFGEIGIDATSLEKGGIEIREINAGCICCTLSGDFIRALKNLVESIAPDRIIIEPTGIGKLSDICRTVMLASRYIDIRLGSLIAIVDPLNYEFYISTFGEFFSDQLSTATTVVLSRAEKAPSDCIETVTNDIRRKYPTSRMVNVPWSAVSASEMLELVGMEDMHLKDGGRICCKTAQADEIGKSSMHGHNPDYGDYDHEDHDHGHGCDHKDHEHKSHDHDHDSEKFQVWSESQVVKCNLDEFRSNFEHMASLNEFGTILRGKGFLVDCRGTSYRFDYVPGEFSYTESEVTDGGGIVIIGKEIDQDALKELFTIIRKQQGSDV